MRKNSTISVKRASAEHLPAIRFTITQMATLMVSLAKNRLTEVRLLTIDRGQPIIRENRALTPVDLKLTENGCLFIKVSFRPNKVLVIKRCKSMVLLIKMLNIDSTTQIQRVRKM